MELFQENEPMTVRSMDPRVGVPVKLDGGSDTRSRQAIAASAFESTNFSIACQCDGFDILTALKDGDSPSGKVMPDLGHGA
jgi:hypothetical protein